MLTVPAFGQNEDGTALSVIIKKVKGLVQVRESADVKWQRAKPDMTLSQGAEFRTGPRSAVEFHIPPDQTIILDRLGTMKVLKAIQNAGKVTTDLGVKYGRTKYKIETGGDLEHESTIRSPNATLAVRGTVVVMSNFAGFKPSARWVASGAEKTAKARHAAVFESAGTSTVFGGGGNDSEVQGNQNAAETANQQSNLGGNDQQKQQQQQDQQQLQSQEQQNRSGNDAIEDLTKPKFDDGNIQFKLIWQSPVADLDFESNVTLSNEAVTRLCSSPATGENCNTVSFTGLEVPFDNSGSPTGGSEILRSGTRGIPIGTYDIGVRHLPETATVPIGYTLQVLRNGQPIAGIPDINATVTPGDRNSHIIEIPEIVNNPNP